MWLEAFVDAYHPIHFVIDYSLELVYSQPNVEDLVGNLDNRSRCVRLFWEHL